MLREESSAEPNLAIKEDRCENEVKESLIGQEKVQAGTEGLAVGLDNQY